MALLYGATGTLSLAAMPAKLASTQNVGLAIAGAFLLVVAFGFKVAAVPFHMWAPDAYDGAPTPVTAFMAAAVKSAAIAAMIRVFGVALGGDAAFGTLGWASPLVVIAALTITIGNITAVRQDNIKRMLAYSSISHAGVLLVGLCSMGLGSSSAQSAIVYYLIAYSVTTLGVFSVVAYVGSKGKERLLIDDWAGLASQHPGRGARDDGLPPVARRHAADRRILRQVLHLQVRDGRVQRPAAVARDHRHRQLGDQHLLLPADRHRDVLPRVDPSDAVDAIGRPRVRDGAVPAAGPRARHSAGLVAPARRRSVASSTHKSSRARAGLDPEYANWQQKPWASSDEALLQALSALGPDLGIAVRNADDAPAALAVLEHARWAEIVPPVVVGWDRVVVVPFSVVADRDGDWELEVTTEGGGKSRTRGRLFELPADSHAQADAVTALHPARDDPRRRARLSLAALASCRCDGRGARDLCAHAGVARAGRRASPLGRVRAGLRLGVAGVRRDG